MRIDLLPTTFAGSLSKLIEESSEVNRVIAKIQMHGPQATDPKTQIKYDNVRDLFLELHDLEHAIEECYRLYYAEHPDATDQFKTIKK
jgi:hypothetical protein